MPGMPWLRLWTDFLIDPRVQCMSEPDQRRFVCVLCLKRTGALELAHYGTVADRDRAIAWAMHLDVEACLDSKTRFMERGLVDADWQPIAWHKRQYPSDSSTLRSRKHRAKLKANRATALNPIQNSESESEDVEVDIEGIPSQRRPRNGHATLQKQNGPRKTPVFIPEDFDPGEAGRAYALKHLPGVDLEVFIEEFRDFWGASATPTARKRDWLKAFRNRVLHCDRYPKLTAEAPLVRYDAHGRVIP
jgi:hypothetical protein